MPRKSPAGGYRSPDPARRYRGSPSILTRRTGRPEHPTPETCGRLDPTHRNPAHAGSTPTSATPCPQYDHHAL